VSITIGKNIPSLTAQRQLSKVDSALATSYERLSSGMRINRASDDAGGLAISSALKTNARIFTQAIRNINDGLSVLNIAEGSIRELSSVVVRIKELAEQSANGVYSTAQRNALDREAQSLKLEFDRVLNTTSFNGVKLLDGSAGRMTLQVGTDSGINSTLDIGFGSIATQTVGTGAFADGVQYSGVDTSGTSIVGDFTGDGLLDVVTAGRPGAAGRPQLFIGNGNGTFNAGVTLSAVSHSHTLSTGDIDGNGILDFVAYIPGTGVRAFLSQGGGSFIQSTIGGTVAAGPSIRLADLNSDNKLDLVASSAINGADFYVMMGNGDGTFKSATTYITDANLYSSNLADINNDGRLDMITAHTGTSLYFWLGQGDGTFSASVSITTNNGTPAFTSIGDANNDGNVDLVTSRLGGSPVVRLGNGNGTFQAGTVPFSSDTAEFMDINGDGFDDLVQYSSTSITIWRSNGDGTFANIDSATIAADGGIFVNTGDANGDGVDDIIIGTNSLFGISVMLAEVSSVGGLGPVDLSSVTASRDTLTNMDATFSSLTSTVGTIGSLQSRLHVALSSAGVAKEAYLGASSRITDVDVAQATADLLRGQILRDIATSILSQANKSPELVLALLR